MKILKNILLPCLMVSFFACENSQDEMPVNETVEFNVVSYDQLKKGTVDIYSTLKVNRENYIQKMGEHDYYNFETLGVPKGFEHFKTRVFLPTEHDKKMIAAVRSEDVQDFANEGIDEIGFSDGFKQYVNETFAFIDVLESKDIAEVEEFFVNALRNVANSSLDEVEKLTLTQMLSNTLAAAKSSYEVEEQIINEAGRSNGCPPNWKAVAEDAFKAGVVGGISYGIQGVRAGAIATTAAGNPIVGGIIGGAIGFTLGFIGGAAAGGAAKLMYDCLFNTQTNTPLMAFTCNGKVYYAYTASAPTGCTPGGGDFTTVPSQVGTLVQLIDITSTNLVPNYGSKTLNSSAVKSLSTVLY
jgi:hypothetical protein